MNYLNMLMSNSIPDIDNERLEYNMWAKTLKGGNGDNTNNIPHGGFPPIIPVKKEQADDTDKYRREREYKSHKGSVSIKQIMENKRNASKNIKIYTQ